MTELSNEIATQALVDTLAETLANERKKSHELATRNALLESRVAEFESRPTLLPPSEADTGKIKTGIDALADYVASVDYLTGEVRGLRSDVANLPSIVRVAAAEGVANAVLDLTARVENLESQVQACEGCPRRKLAGVA